MEWLELMAVQALVSTTLSTVELQNCEVDKLCRVVSIGFEARVSASRAVARNGDVGTLDIPVVFLPLSTAVAISWAIG